MPVVVTLGLIGAGLDVAYRKMDLVARWANSPESSLGPVHENFDVSETRWIPAADAPANEGSFLRTVALWSRSRNEEIPKVDWADGRVARLPPFLEMQAELNRVPKGDLVSYLEESFTGDRLPSGFTGRVVARRGDDVRTIFFMAGKRIRTERSVGVKETVVTPG